MSGVQILPRDLTSNISVILANNNRPRIGSVINHGVLVDACEMFDRCTPNPCRHGGTCYQVNRIKKKEPTHRLWGHHLLPACVRRW